MIRITSRELDRLLVHPMYRRPLRGILIFVALLAAVAAVAVALPALPGMRGIANYLPLHMLFETFAIIVAVLVFAVGWHAHSRDLPGNIVLLACAFFGVGLLDFAHMLSYTGMPEFVTPGNPEKGINFWLVARSLAAAALFAAALMPWRPFVSAATRYTLLAGVIAATALAYWLFLYHQEAMPRTFIPGEGLTPFKIASEYIIILLHLGTALVLWLRMRQPLSFNVTALFGAVCVMALSEFFFTLYSSVADLYNLLGHVYKAIAYLLLYRVFFIEVIETPYRELELSKAKLHGTLDAIPDLVWLRDPRGIYLDCNAAFERYLGAPKERIVGRSDYDFVSEELAGSFREHDRKAVVANKPVVGEEWLTYAVDGDHGLFEIVKTPLYDDSGNLIGVLGVARDITGRKRDEEALRRSETRFRTLYESTGDAVMLVGEQGFIDCNKAALAMFGCATKEEFCMM
ncbi:MAG: PAS domain-containing protein, partial [Gallionella sp.]|nr:PAS domain-containing protein [Gallionella sp.]